MLGATGTVGRATAAVLVARGHDVVCAVRPGAPRPDALAAAELRAADVTDPASLRRDAIRGERFDALVSCLASRTGTPRDARAVDHLANRDALDAAREAGATQIVLCSAICVQTPRLAFQREKLAIEAAVAGSGLAWSIVRPTALFKSLSGQLDRVRAGRPFLVFGDGLLTACAPIADADLGAYLADCLDDPSRRDRILPIGGPGPALTPRAQGEAMFRALGLPPRFRQVPVATLDAIVAGLALLGRVSPALAGKAELARIGRHYATHSMLALDPATGRPSADATPRTGTVTLADYFAQVAAGETEVERGAHAVFRTRAPALTRSSGAGARPR